MDNNSTLEFWVLLPCSLDEDGMEPALLSLRSLKEVRDGEMRHMVKKYCHVL